MFEREIGNLIRKKRLFSLKDKIVVACSGGADSVALLRVLLKLGYSCVAAHCNFHLRGEESDRDEDFVTHLCRSYGVPLYLTHFDTRSYAARQEISVEMAARKLRYEWFEQIRLQTGSEVIAVAHHQDDSVETILLNLIRGTGIGGLKGIRFRNGKVVRPLLAAGREDILAYLSGIGQPYVTDSTNLEDEYIRNKIRLRILPEMEKINPSVKKSILFTAKNLSDVSAVYDKSMEEGRRRVRDERGIRIAALREEASPRGLLFEILYPLGFNSSQIDEILGSLEGQAGRRFFSSGWTVLKDRTHLLLSRREDNCMEENALAGMLAFPEKDTVELPGKKIRMKRLMYSPDFAIPGDTCTACLDAGNIQFPLSVRKWRPGDRFIPFGMKGKKKVSDYLTDCKRSLYEKDRTYVVCSGEQIVWVVGERSDNRYRIKEDTKEVVLLSVEENQEIG